MWVSAGLCLSEEQCGHVECQECHKQSLSPVLVTVSFLPCSLPSFPPSGQDSRFEISENGTLRINNVEVYDGTIYKCVSSTPAGSIEGYARVHVLGMLTSTPHPLFVGSSSAWQGAGVRHSSSAAFCGWGGSNSTSVCCREAEVHPSTPAAAVHGV